MGLFRRNKKEKKEPEPYVVPEERITEIREYGVDVEVVVGTHSNDELVAGSMLGSTGKLIAMNNYGKPIYKSTKLFFLPDGIKFQFNGEFFDHIEISSLEKRKVGLINVDFAFITDRGEVLLKATAPDFLAILEIFGRDVEAYQLRKAGEEKQAEEDDARAKAEPDMDRLIRLGELHERGLLSDEEFDEAKSKLLGSGLDSDKCFCPNCGVEVSGGNFCMNCGHKL